MIRLALVLVAVASPALAADPDPREQTTLRDAEKLFKRVEKGAVKVLGRAEVDPKLEAGARVAITLDTVDEKLLVGVSKLPCVGSLAISDATGATAVGLGHLRKLPNLQKLILTRADVSKAPAAAAIGGVQSLQELYVGESKLADNALAEIKKLKKLRALDVYQSQVTDRGLAHLAALPRLEDLNLSGTKVTDNCVGPLKGLKGLKLLRVTQTEVTREGVTRLEEALPKTTVRF